MPCEYRFGDCLLACLREQSIWTWNHADILAVKGAAIVSSFAAVGDFSTPFYKQDGRVYSEDDWLAWTDEDCEKADEKK